MKLLIASPHLPILPGEGGTKRIYQLLRHLLQRHEVTFVCFVSAPADVGRFRVKAPWAAQLRILPVSVGTRSLPGMLWTFLRGEANFVTTRTRPRAHQEMVALLGTELSSGRFDAVHVDTLPMLQYVSAEHRPRVVLGLTDAPSLYYGRVAALSRSRTRRWWMAAQESRARRCEQWLGTVPSVVVNSPVDRDALALRENVRVIPNGVDASYFYPQDRAEQGNRIVFTGVMDYDFNVDAILYFADEVFPLIRRRVPDTQLWVVGQSPIPAIRALANRPGIYVTGWVEDVRPYLWESKLFICPLRGGAGMKNKVLEALACGCPVVSTPLGCDGLEVADGVHVRKAQLAEPFADAVVNLLVDSDARWSMRARAVTLVRERYQWETYAASYERLYMGAAASVRDSADEVRRCS